MSLVASSLVASSLVPTVTSGGFFDGSSASKTVYSVNRKDLQRRKIILQYLLVLSGLCFRRRCFSWSLEPLLLMPSSSLPILSVHPELPLLRTLVSWRLSNTSVALIRFLEHGRLDLRSIPSGVVIVARWIPEYGMLLLQVDAS